MSQNNPRSVIPSKGNFLSDLMLRIKLIFRLMADNRINPIYKLIPIGSLIYLFFPDIAFGPVDDAAVIWLGSYLFIELCPPAVVEEHLRELTAGNPGNWKTGVDDDVIDADYTEEK